MRKIKLQVKDFADDWILLYDGDENAPELREAVKVMQDAYDGHAVQITYYGRNADECV
jgi:hypothetical protein